MLQGVGANDKIIPPKETVKILLVVIVMVCCATVPMSDPGIKYAVS